MFLTYILDLGKIFPVYFRITTLGRILGQMIHLLLKQGIHLVESFLTCMLSIIGKG
jgi:hypothetical protein